MTKQTKTITHTQISTWVTLTLITNRKTNNQNKDSVGIQICMMMILIINSASCNGKCTQWSWCEEMRRLKEVDVYLFKLMSDICGIQRYEIKLSALHFIL